MRRSEKNRTGTVFFCQELFDLFIFEGEGGNPKLCISMDFFIITNPSVHSHTHKKVFSLLYKAQFKAAFRNKRQNKCYCYSQYTDVYSYLPPTPPPFPLPSFISTTVFSVTS